MHLITGATGLVGSHLAYSLTAKGERVRLLYRKDADRELLREIFSWYSKEPESLLSLVEWAEGDVRDVYTLEDAMENITDVYHCAATVSFVPADRKMMLAVNIEGTANMVNAALEKNIRKFCHVSSVAALGKAVGGGAVNENHHWKTDPSNSWYAISKYGAEREVWRGTEEGLNAVIVNPSLVLGPGNWNRSSLETVKMAAGGLKWYPPGSSGFVDVRDVVKAMLLLMQSEIKSERYIINGANHTHHDFVAMLNKSFGHPAPTRRAGAFALALAWRTEKILAALAGRKPRITRETARAAQEKNIFSGEKILALEGFSYSAFEETIRNTTEFFRAKKSAGK